MKNIFPEFYEKSDEDFKELWDDPLVVLDACALLNFYRYTSQNREHWFNVILKTLDDKLVLPHQIALEYQNNRLSVISDQKDKCLEIINQLSVLKRQMFGLLRSDTKALAKEINPAFDKIEYRQL